MPSPKTHRRGGVDKNKKVARLSEKSSSFHGKDAGVAAEMIPRPRTAPDLLSGRRSAGVSTAVAPPSKLTKLLVHVTLLRSPGPVHVLVSPEATVKDLIDAALRQYVKEARRPMLPSGDAAAFDLHFSQFSLESLNEDEKVAELGSRNFFLCPRKAAAEGGAAVGSSCSEEAEKGMKKGMHWLKFMDFLL